MHTRRINAAVVAAIACTFLAVDRSPGAEPAKTTPAPPTSPEKRSTEEVLSQLEKEFAAGQRGASVTLKDHAFDGVREDRRFRDLIHRFAETHESWLAPEDEPGERLHVSGRITDREGKPVGGALIYVYHTDHTGVYSSKGGNATMGDSLNPRIFAYIRTQADGTYAYHTIRPAGYPGDGPPAHVHYEVTAPGFRRKITELMFTDDPRLTPDSRRWAEAEGFALCTPRRDADQGQFCTADFTLERE